jgi:N-methylhydantoinase B
VVVRAPRAEGVALALYANRFENVVRSMANTLFRSARSGVINTAHDFSCCVISHDDELVAAANSLPIHVLSGPELLSRSMKRLHPELRRGDAFLHNSPYDGNSHAADHVLLVPVVDDDGAHRFTVMVKAHQADCGNATPTTYDPHARDVYEEGALIFPCVQVQREGEDVRDILRMCEARIRVPEQWRADYRALVGAARTGERRLRELAEEAGWDELVSYAAAWREYGERRAIAAIRAMPAGRTSAVTVHDPFPGIPEGLPITAHVAVDPEAATIEVDLRDNADCLPSGINLTESTARTAALIGIFNSLPGDVPVNGGSMRRMRVHLRENCCVGIPVHPASCSLATTNLATRTANVVGRALAEVADGLGMADAGLILPPSASVISGRDPRHDGAPFINMLILAGSGGAGSPHADGWLTMGDAGTAGMLRRDSVEIDELRFPICVEMQRLIPDTEGAGRRRGTPGTLVEFGPLGCDIQAQYASDGHHNEPLGVRGGLPGGRADQWLIAADGSRRRLPPSGTVTVADGELIVSVCTGGGGYGPPLEREPERVREDVAEGWITRERARDVYGVVIGDDGAVDVAATTAARAATTSAPGTSR